MHRLKLLTFYVGVWCTPWHAQSASAAFADSVALLDGVRWRQTARLLPSIIDDIPCV